MNFEGHTVSIIIVWGVLGVLKITALSPWVLLPAILTSALMDTDLKIPYIKHRGITHSLFFMALLAGITYLIARGTGLEIMIVHGIILGGMMHVIGDRI